MATPRKKWPHECEWARLDTIAHAENAWRILDELLDELDNAHQVRQIGRAMDHLKEIKFKMTACKGSKEESL